MYKVFGYDMMCIDYSYTFDSFIEAIKCFIKLNNTPDVVFISGVSAKVEQSIIWMH